MLLLRTATTTAAAKKAKFTATYLGPLCRRGSDEISCSITGHAFPLGFQTQSSVVHWWSQGKEDTEQSIINYKST